jgi:Spy/CpxP family protein refolding chaperone
LTVEAIMKQPYVLSAALALLLGAGTFAVAHFAGPSAAVAQTAPAGTAAPSASPGEAGEGAHGGRHHRGMGKFFKELNLSADQKAKVKQIMSDARKKSEGADPQTRRADMKAAMQTIRDTVLTPAQQKLFDQHMAKMKAWEKRRESAEPSPSPSVSP